jgi:hypothetical protein
VTYALLVLAGALLCNCIPHLASGLRGEAFPTPFAPRTSDGPPGKGVSPPVINFVWGAANLLIGISLLPRLDDVDPRLGRLALLVGFLLIGLYLSRHFGQVRAAREDHR